MAIKGIGAGLLGVLMLASAGMGDFAQAAGAARVAVFSPQGRVKQVRQVRVRFSAPMTSLGYLRQKSPFSVDCSAKGAGRWADDRNWVYDFDEDVPGGLRCAFTLARGLKTLAGAPVGGKTLFRFNTGVPGIRASVPYEGSRRVDENQVFLLGLEAPATLASIKQRAHCAIEGVGEQVPVKVLAGAEREAVLAGIRKSGYRYRHLTGAQNNRAAKAREGRIVMLTCQRTLPAEHRVALIWGQGIAAPSGLVTTRVQKLAFRTRPAFAARFSCQRSHAGAPCLPMMDMRLNFTAPIAADIAAKIALVGPDDSHQSPDQGGEKHAPMVSGITFKAPFAPGVQFSLELPDGLRDDAGRPLQNASTFPLTVHTGGYPPLVKFASNFGIIEARAGALLPVTVRNIESGVAARMKVVPGAPASAKIHRERDVFAMLKWMKKAEAAGRWRGQWVKDKSGKEVWRNETGSEPILRNDAGSQRLTLPRSHSAKAFEVVGIPLKKPGFYVVEIKSEALGAALLGRSVPRYVATTALVTDMAVHFEWGREGSLVWVTALGSGKPVAGAKIVLGDSCTGQTLWNGVSGTDGTAHIAASLGQPSGWGSCRSDVHPLVISAARGDDFSFVLSTWNDGIAPYDFDISQGDAWQADFARTIFDRTLLRAGQTVSMKILARRHTGAGFALPPGFEKDSKIRISHDASGQEVYVPVTFDAKGSALASYAIPKTARFGRYAVAVRIGKGWKDAGGFRVEAFRLPTMQAIVQGPPDALIAPKRVPVDVMVRYLSGGGASGLAVKLRTLIRPAPAHFADYEEYRFVSESLHPQTSSTGQGENEGEKLSTGLIPARLDGEGAARLSIDNLPAISAHNQLTAELEYRDANGQVLTKAARFDLWPAALAVGIKTDGWAATTDKLKLHAIALNVDGKAASGTAITVKAYQRQRYSWRKRLIGGFYSYETITKITPLNKGCSGKAGKGGIFTCTFAPGMSGEMILQAAVRDAKGRTATATTSIWVAGKNDWWFAAHDGNRMDLLVENSEYEGGDTARVQVRSPFRKATALVTIEREGVLDSFVTTISGKKPVIKVPVKGHYAPNVFVSVLAVRGRTSSWQNWLADKARQNDLSYLSRDGGSATALIDLAKPSWRLGLAKMRVGWKAHRLDVRVQPEHKIYQIRQQVNATITVRRADGTALAPGADVALAVVDEALLQLAPNRSWNVLKAMMDERDLEVLTTTAQMQVVGKRTFGRKAVAHGGGGGRASARALFDTLLLWQGQVKLDENGQAQVHFPLNDSLSRFRIVAIAEDGLAHFGTGSASITTTQDVQILSGLPAMVRENDRFDALFSVRNATSRAMTVLARGGASGIGALPAREITIPAGQARPLRWDVLAPFDVDRLVWRISVNEKSGPAKDTLKISQRVEPAVPVRTYQATLRRLDAPVQMSMARPADALTGRGGVAVRLQARLGSDLQGVKAYMKVYPYRCLEQRTSIAIALEDKTRWAQTMAALPAYMDDDGLVKYWPTDFLAGSDTLTAYVLSVSDTAGWKIPDAQRAQMLDGLQSFVEGRTRRDSPLPTADLSIRKLAAIAALARFDRAKAPMLSALHLDVAKLPTSAVLDWLAVLKRLHDMPGRTGKIARAGQILRARLNFQGTHMGFSTDATDGLWWLMVSPDTNAARALISLADAPQWRADMGRMARGLLGRQHKGHWRTTTANAWGALAMRAFSKRFERETVSGQSTLALNGKSQSLRWDKNGTLQFALLPWGKGAQKLRLAQSGPGTPWAFITAKAAIPLRAPLSSGYAITRTISPVSQAAPGAWRSGDVMRVHIAVRAQADMSWVVINDPVPAGAQILGSGLGGDSALLSRGEQSSGRAWPVFEERRAGAYQAFYRFVPKGSFSFDYTVRLNTAGDFNLPPTRVEAMYAPEMFGEVPIAPLHIAPAQP